jgi:hypothetical protein
MPSAVLILATAAVWVGLLTRPRAFVTALLVTAPWPGLFVRAGWEFDAFRIGLILAPLLAVYGLQAGRLGVSRFPLLLLPVYAVGVGAWALGARELLEYDAVRIVGFESRVAAQTTLCVWRSLLPLLIVSIGRDERDAERWLDAYSWSVFVLCCYGLFQAVAFVTLGTPVTPIFRDGLFGSITEHATVNFFGVEFLRVHSFSREPKDLALFCVPALAWLFVRLNSPWNQRRRTDRIRLFVISACALVTFASSLLLMVPAMFAVIGWLRPRLSLPRRLRYWLGVMATLAPLMLPFLVISQSRVLGRFQTARSLLQPSREAPALEFLRETWPRSAFGYGMGTQAFYLLPRMPAEYAQKALDHRAAAGVDSMLVSTLSDLGIPGLVLTLWVIGSALSTRRSHAPVAWTIRAATGATALMGIPLNPGQQGAILWLLVGLTCLAKRQAHYLACFESTDETEPQLKARQLGREPFCQTLEIP